jgi:hypothetical protein
MVATAALLLVGYLDHRIGHELSVLPLYFLPLAWATARFGLGAGLWMVLPATLVWYAADLGHPYSHGWYRLSNALGRGFAFACAVVAAHHLFARPGQQSHGEASGNPPTADVCEACHSVRPPGGIWEDPVDYLREEAAVQLRPRLCPVCARRRAARAAATDLGDPSGGACCGADPRSRG